MGRKESNHRKTKQFYAERFCLSKTCELYTTCMFFSIYLSFHSAQGTNIFKYCTCPAGQVTYNFHSFCKHKHLSFKSLCNKEHKGVICNMTSSSDSFLRKGLLVLSRFHSSGIFVPCCSNLSRVLYDFQYFSMVYLTHHIPDLIFQGGQSRGQHDRVQGFPQPVKSSITFIILSQISCGKV